MSKAVGSVAMFAYACDPTRGSEPGNGWNWASALAELGWDVSLLTPTSNAVNIESHARPGNVATYYVDIPHVSGSGSLRRPAMYGQYVMWMRDALRFARLAGLQKSCDVSHHTTWGGLFFGSALSRLGPPFIFGPVGGAQEVPSALMPALSARDQKHEARRAYLYRNALWLSGAGATIRRSSVVLASSAAAQRVAVRLGAHATRLTLPDGLTGVRAPTPARKQRVRRILWLGRALPIKGLNLALRAFAVAHRLNDELELIVAGDGPSLGSAKAYATVLGINNAVHFLGQVPHAQTHELLRETDMLLFTSIRDTFGAQVLEALGHGVPVVALSHHGVGDHCPDDALIKVRTFESPEHATELLAEGITRLANDDSLVERLSLNALAWARTQTWKSKAARMAELYSDLLAGQR